jgi:hypothetical protein
MAITWRLASRTAVAAAALVVAGCVQGSTVLLANIPLPPGMSVEAVENPAGWTSMTPEDALAIARAEGDWAVGQRPVVRFLWLREGPRPFAGQAAPVWIIVSDDVPQPRRFGGDAANGRPGPGANVVVVPKNAFPMLTWAVVSADGHSLGVMSGTSTGPLVRP